MKFVNSLPPREVEGADQVLDGVVARCESGNFCRFWPALTYDEGSNQTRIAFFVEWYREATEADEAELVAGTDALMGKSPAMVTKSDGNPCRDPLNLEWLRTGKVRKAN